MAPPVYIADFSDLPSWRRWVGAIADVVFSILAALVKAPTFFALRLAGQDAKITPHGLRFARTPTADFIVAPCLVWQAGVNITAAAAAWALGAHVTRKR